MQEIDRLKANVKKGSKFGKIISYWSLQYEIDEHIIFWTPS